MWDMVGLSDNNLAWRILSWTPQKDLWQYLIEIPVVKEQVDVWQSAFLLWLGQQIAEMMKLLANLLLSFPVHFIAHESFIELYWLACAISLVVLPVLMLSKSIMLVAGSQRWEVIELDTILIYIVRFALISSLIFRIPWIFGIIMNGANQVVSALLAQMQINLFYEAIPYGFGAELVVVSLLCIVAIYSIRLILFYAIRNIYLLWLLLQAPIVLTRWILLGENSDIEEWWGQLLAMILIQAIHAFLLVLLSRFVSAGPPLEAGEQIGKLWLVIGQIGIMELMLKPQLILKYMMKYTPISELASVASAWNHVSGRKFRYATSNLKRRLRNA